MADRERLTEGYQLCGGNRVYIIGKYVGAGANSMVYQAFYEDTLMKNHRHQVLIKELYPWDSRGRIYRGSENEIIVEPEAENFFEYHKDSFLKGNQVHLELEKYGEGGIAENRDSFQTNGTYYTVLTAKKGMVLSEFIEEGGFLNLTESVDIIQKLLQSLKKFHQHGFLHLDISPDNIFLVDADVERGVYKDVLILDFNSAYSMEEREGEPMEYYLGKPGYMAPEVVLHQREELGPCTDLYSVCVVFYEAVMGERLPEDRELLSLDELVSPYSKLLLHEKETTAYCLNRILKKGLQISAKKRYQNIEEMTKDIEELSGVLEGTIRLPLTVLGSEEKKKGRSAKTKWAVGLLTGAVLVSVATGAFWMGTRFETEQSMEPSKLDLTKYSLETNDQVVLLEKNSRQPLPNNVMEMQVQGETSVRIKLKDYSHERDVTEGIDSCAFFPIYNGKGDKRGWQFNDTTYDFFYTEENKLHVELPFQDTNSFPLDYVGLIYQNHNRDEINLLMDVLDCKLVDGKGEIYEITELEGSHFLFYDEENWQWNLTTTQNQEFVKTFEDIYGGKLVVDVQIGFLDPLLEVKWKSDNPEVAEVDDKGRVFGKSQGETVLTAEIKDKKTGQQWKTQMLVHVKSKLG